MALMKKAVFIDKDGTAVQNLPYNADPELMKFMPGFAEGILRLYQAGYKILIVSNQAGVAFGYFPERALKAVEEKLKVMFQELPAELGGFYYCPHHPEALIAEYKLDCQCRKPKPDLLLRAAKDQQIDLNESWMIGDILHDVEAGHRAGVRTILVDVGNETEWKFSAERNPSFLVNDFNEAASCILGLDLLKEQIRGF